MFLAAVARPSYDHEKDEIFDGDIRIWTFVEAVKAKRSFENRPKATSPKLTPILSEKKETIRKMLVENVLLATSRKRPQESLFSWIMLVRISH